MLVIESNSVNSKFFASLIKPNKRAPERLNFSTLEVFCIIH